MTKRGSTKRRKLAYELLGLSGISVLCALALFWFLSWVAAAIAENYCIYQDIVMTEFDWMEVDRWIFRVSALVSAGFFSVMFLALLGDRISYIHKLTEGIDRLCIRRAETAIPLEGNNELTELAEAINHMAATQQLLREKEQALATQKDQLIRTLSHDIRTPLTSILAYSEYLAGAEDLSTEESRSHLQVIRKKAEQIRELTDILLDGGKRNLEQYEDAHLLMEQLCAEFEEELEDRFSVCTDLSGCPCFAGSFDVGELRRIFDNLSSNVQKYADPEQPVCLTLRVDSSGLVIRQTNGILPRDGQETGYQLGINSIRRIAQHYGGQVEVQPDGETFAITVTLLDF